MGVVVRVDVGVVVDIPGGRWTVGEVRGGDVVGRGVLDGVDVVGQGSSGRVDVGVGDTDGVGDGQ
ncbi:hypothetical protein AB0M22_33855 [Nocardia sp. NPDC051756]|uniref:hypothetical protein n=1 Tax=Nocardia sp. NPDC051756 TaxID=3154751 RepID=UPI0034352F0A